MANKKTKEINKNEKTYHDYMVECLKEAVNYCYEQYHDNCGEIDPLPSIKALGLSNEDSKFVLLRDFLNKL